MLLPTMLEVVSTVRRLNLVRLPIRKNATKAEIMKNRMKEDKDNFGPLLETSKQRRMKLKLAAKQGKSYEIAETKNSKDNGNNSNDAELSWTIGTTKTRNLRFLVKTEKDKQKDSLSNAIRMQQLSRLSESLQSKNPNEITKISITNLSNTGDPSQLSERDNEIVPFSSTKIGRQVEDFSVTEENDDRSCDESIGEETFLKSVANDASYFSMMNSLKSQDDKWENSGIVSLRPGDQQEFSLPGVTRILNETMSEQGKLLLEKWKRKMTLELGEEGFKEYCKNLLEDSKMMHSLIEKSLRREEPPEVPQHLKLSFNSMKLVLKDLSDVRMLESHVVHPTLGYRGFIDCVASYRGNLCIIDWKKSEKIKTLSTTYDSPIQVSAYIGALNADPNYPFQVKSGLVAIAYTRGQPPSVFEFSAARLEFYWREWLKRLEKYKSMRNI